MLSRRLVSSSRSLGSSNFALRSFSTAIPNQQPKRAPALADITPDDAPKFESRQAIFREMLAAAKKKKQEEAKATQVVGPGPVEAAKRKGGAFSSLIYGTKEGQQLDKEIETSFSQALARGKYVHSIVFHDVKPDKVDEYVELVGGWYPRMASMPENRVNLVGSWRTEVGDCDTFVHIWEYQKYQGYHASLHSIASHPEFPAFDKKLKSLITSKKTSLMQEFSFWPTTPPRQLGGVFELRSYTLHPGNLLEWETHWRRGLKARREVMEGVGAWFCQIGDLNTVHHLWQFADLEERKVRREQSWGIEGWGETVHKTVPLIQSMKSRILIPMPWSPVA
ncbi:NIPSNAP family protein [Xylona heveae TC161]|uniref:NIPSNAP family protein n=1 Tax=Xylona heveae (strain CBS 132557 / TC161) TaxID=1328760 RepID=A0A164ZME2_XYLHT|nr:NIPSNAP family protein [Xylona heveae TC161]KZF19277.1 NIPSNAP family protein [Xylona heveae TC161]